ncbi:NADH-quinone oxidoreductase subunit C [Desulfacinum infernum DSM 9756]|uniref:NADH-quinone oxidoreductase n=1 Tax=Desulfacinum infernum DSM 9756 TaxID=1121391 RepID=A0A1M5C489_9BACT|nr:NADH-quinone oxidoreductase subunit C [Desulfacinum infernum]SHF49583.1 NADH-quinone oxidoreductase subunit C [Desulfacinum infernum DSM 9756]
MAARDEVVRRLREMLGEAALAPDEDYAKGVSWTVQVPAASLPEVLGVFKEAGFYLESMTGLDFQDTLEIVYHMNTYEPRSRMAVRVLCPHDGEVPSATGLYDSALWQEREVWEFFGVRFAGHPDLRPLLLPEDSTERPLRKTFGTVHAYRKREEIYG